MKKAVKFILAACVAVVILTMTAFAADTVANGTCGTTLTWNLDSEGTLTISGSGVMEDYTYKGTPWYEWSSSIKNVDIPGSITNIGDYAFFGFDSLTSVDIGGSLTSIGDRAFYGCTSLTSVDIPDSVTNIDGYAFYGCTSLTSVDIPDSVTSIGISAFSHCTNLISIDISNSVTTIESGAFSSCKNLVNIDIPDGITTIASDMFYNCSSLTSVDIPHGVTRIGGEAFSLCKSLTRVTIPDSVTHIEDWAFQGSSLERVTIPNGVTYIGRNAFACQTLSAAIVYSRNTSFSIWVFSGADDNFKLSGYAGSTAEAYAEKNGHTFVALPEVIASGACGDNLTWTLYNDGELVIDGTGAMTEFIFNSMIPWNAYWDSIKKVTIKEGVTSIGEMAFGNCTALESVTIADSVKKISRYAFYRCTALKNVVIPEGITEIEYRAFRYCYSLESAHLPESLTAIGDGAFEECYELADINLHDGITSIGEYAFTSCKALKEITLPANLTKISKFSFYGCKSLTSIEIPKRVKIIDSSAFDDCTALADVTMYEGVETIGHGAFKYCPITSIELSTGLKSLGNNVFSGCTKLKSIVIPEGVETIGNWTFSGCKSLTSVSLPKTLVSIGTAFDGCTALTSITVDAANANYSSKDGILFDKNKTTIVAYPAGKATVAYTVPASVTAIGDYAFSDNTSLKSINLHNGITYIGNAAFIRCTALDGVTLPESVTYIGWSAFNKCTALTSIDIPKNVTEIGNIAFTDCENLTKATVYASGATFGTNVFEDTSVAFELYGYAGSTAETYAKANSHTFVAMTAPIKTKSATLLLEDIIKIRYTIVTEESDATETGLLVFASKADADAHDLTKAVATYPIDGDGYAFTDGIPAKKMGDSQFVVAFAKFADGSYIFDKTIEYSPKIYAQRTVAKSSSSTATKAMCHAIMNYGAMAQTALDNKTSGLMNEGFNAVSYSEAVLGETVFSVNSNVVNGMKINSATLILEGAITYRIKITPSGAAVGKTLYAEYTTMGKTESVEIVNENGAYYAYITGVAAKNMDEVVTIKPYYLNGSKKVYGGKLVYSGYEYVRRTVSGSANENTKNLAKALAMYIDAANTLFG